MHLPMEDPDYRKLLITIVFVATITFIVAIIAHYI